MSKKLREKANSFEFNVATTKTPAEIQQIGQRCADAEKRTMGGSMQEVNAGPNQITYVVKGVGGLSRLMQMAVNIDDDGSKRNVSLKVGEFSYSRPTVFGFVPIGPASAPAMKTLQRFSTRLRQELA